jgi:hypothetical protein
MGDERRGCLAGNSTPDKLGERNPVRQQNLWVVSGSGNLIAVLEAQEDGRDWSTFRCTACQRTEQFAIEQRRGLTSAAPSRPSIATVFQVGP